jgi:hypothetical protein
VFLQVDGQEGQDYQSAHAHEPPYHSNSYERRIPDKFSYFSDLSGALGPGTDACTDAYQTTPDQKGCHQGRDDLKLQHGTPVKNHQQGSHSQGCEGITNIGAHTMNRNGSGTMLRESGRQRSQSSRVP